jgi:hypothetical protein
MQTNFSTTIRPARQAQLRRRFAAGLPVFRGKQDGRAPSDPGDFGQGTYYSTSKARAANYGALKPFTIVLTKPLLLTVEEAYTQIADRYGTISGVAGHPETVVEKQRSEIENKHPKFPEGPKCPQRRV